MNYWKLTVFRKIAACFMMLALLWLTVSLPVVNEYFQKATSSSIAYNDNNEDGTNPLVNTNEEKTSNFTFSEEYLHHQEFIVCYPPFVPQVVHAMYQAPLYIAFHGELISPPPEI